jgi:uncharacterized protein (TIGR02996 family)
MAKSEKALVRAIAKLPEDDGPRLAYADWLDAHGQEPRARLIRLQCDIAKHQHEADALIRQHGREWVAPLTALNVGRCRFHRGMPEELSVPIRAFLAHHKEIADVTPIRRLDLGLAGDADVEAVAKLRITTPVRSLTIGSPNDHLPSDFGVPGLRALVVAPWMESLHDLSLNSHNLGAEGAALIAESPHLKNLRTLEMDDPAFQRPGDESGDTLLLSPNLPSLQHLQLGVVKVWAHQIDAYRRRSEYPDRSR